MIDFAQHLDARSRMCHRIQKRERVDVENILTVLAKQHVSVVIRADSVLFQFYSDVGMQFWCGRKTDHGVLTAGYDTAARILGKERHSGILVVHRADGRMRPAR